MSKDKEKKLGSCPSCGANMDLVGLSHRCIPRAPIETKMKAAPKKKRASAGQKLSEPSIGVRDKTKAVLQQKVDAVPSRKLPPSHPDCDRCKELNKRAAGRVKRSRERKTNAR